MSLSRKIPSPEPPHHLPASISVLLLMLFLVLLTPKTAYSVDVTLAWSANTETDLAGYRIYHREEGQAYDFNYPLWEGTETTCKIYNLDDYSTHCFVARAFDISGNESTDSIEVYYQSLGNIAPTADAGPDQTVDEGSTVILDGSNSWDADGTVVSYSWTQVDGLPVTLSETSTAQPIFTAPDVSPDGASLTFQLTVTDDGGLQSADTCIVDVADSNMLNVGPVCPAVYVSIIAIELNKKGPYYQARAYVVVLDESDMVVKEASLRGDWTLNGTSLGASFGSTNGKGVARLNADKVRAASGDTFTLIVTEITKDGCSYDTAGTTRSVAVP